MIDVSKIDPQALYTEREAAPLIGRKVPSLQKYRWAGIGPRYIKQGKPILYRGSDLISWLGQGLVETQGSNALSTENKNSHSRGENHPKATLSDEQVAKLRELRESGLGYKRISGATGIHISTVKGIVKGRTRQPSVNSPTGKHAASWAAKTREEKMQHAAGSLRRIAELMILLASEIEGKS